MSLTTRSLPFESVSSVPAVAIVNLSFGQRRASAPFSINRWCFALGLLITSCCTTPGVASPDALSSFAQESKQSATQSDQIDALIAELGDADFYARENAERELLRIGRPAIEAVRASRLSSDNEVRLRARRLLKKLLRNDFQKQLSEFLSQESSNTTLPAWEEFSRITGSHQTARELFAVIYAKSPELFQALEDNDLESAHSHYKKLAKEIERMQMRSLHVCSILFADTFEFDTDTESLNDRSSTETAWSTARRLIRTSSYLKNSYLVKFSSASGFKKEFDSILANWIKHLPEEEIALNNSKIMIIERHGLAELLPMVTKVLADTAETHQARARAISIVATLGNESFLDELQPWLSSRAIVGHFNESSAEQMLEVRLSDITLAACVFLSGQPLQDYGFRVNQKERFVSLSQAGFATEEERENALQKWNQYYRARENGDE